MEKQFYITEGEREKYQKVVDAFAELYEVENIVVLDVGRYGFVELKYYKPPHGFEEDATFTDIRVLFEELWQEWQNTKLFLLSKDTLLSGKGYEGIFESLTDEEQVAITERKAVFAEQAGISL